MEKSNTKNVNLKSQTKIKHRDRPQLEKVHKKKNIKTKQVGEKKRKTKVNHSNK